MTKEYTVDQPVDDWIVVEWNDHFDPEIRPKFTNYYLASGEAVLLNHDRVTTEAYYGKPDQWHRCGRRIGRAC
jgi:hypothetical protein